MSLCALCGIGCIPMADYQVPVCYRCDAAFEDRLLAALAPKLPPWAARLPLSYRTGAADPADLAALMAAFRVSS